LRIAPTRTNVVVSLHSKNYPHTHGYFVASIPHFNGTGSVYACIRKSTE